MEIFTDIIEIIIIPPGLFLLILSFLIISFLFKWRRTSFIVLLFSIVFLYTFSITPGKFLLLKPLEDSNPSIKEVNIKSLDYDAVVILGGGINNYSPEYDSGYEGQLVNGSFKRVFYGSEIYKKKRTPIIVSGGGKASDDNMTEAEVMKNYLIRMDVKSIDIIEEKKSKTTEENIKNIKKIIKEEDYEKILIITSAFHSARAAYVAKKEDINFQMASTDYRTDRAGSYGLGNFIPSISTFNDSIIAYREYLAFIFYKIKNGDWNVFTLN